jgi:hypothetical protein
MILCLIFLLLHDIHLVLLRTFGIGVYCNCDLSYSGACAMIYYVFDLLVCVYIYTSKMNELMYLGTRKINVF